MEWLLWCMHVSFFHILREGFLIILRHGDSVTVKLFRFCKSRLRRSYFRHNSKLRLGILCGTQNRSNANKEGRRERAKRESIGPLQEKVSHQPRACHYHWKLWISPKEKAKRIQGKHMSHMPWINNAAKRTTVRLSFKNDQNIILEFDGAIDLDTVSTKTSHVSALNYDSWFKSGLFIF